MAFLAVDAHGLAVPLSMLIVFGAAKLLAELFERTGQPGIVGEILAGVLVGPSVLNWIQPGELLTALSELGVMFLLFRVGLEVKASELVQVGATASMVAVAGVILPFVLGWGIMLAWGYPQVESVFMGAAMVATSVGITARVLADMKVLHTHAARIIITAAVFDDILGMVLLAIIAGVVRENGIEWRDLSITIALAAAFAIIMLFYAPRMIGRMRPGIRRMYTPNAPLILALGICLAFSVAAEHVGMAAIIGAFFAGLAFAEYAPEWNLHARVDGIAELLSPYFFFVMGARLNLGVFSGSLIWSAVGISFLAIISKIIGCGLPLLPEGWRTGLRVGVGMVPRGEVGLIVALVGLNMGVISESAYALVISMTAATTIAAPVMLRYVFHAEDASLLPASLTEAAPSR